MNIIAEAGCNWHTRREAVEFIRRSKELGLFATKFQIYNDDLIKDNPHREFLKSIMIDKNLAKMLFLCGQQIDQEVFFTPMFPEAVEWCEDIGVNYYKIRYMDRYNHNIINKIIETDKPYFRSVDTIGEGKVRSDNEIQLYCVPEYPANYLDYINQYPQCWDIIKYNGISDHTPDLRLMKESKNTSFCEYFEKHMKLNWNCIEEKWSITFNQLEEALK